MRAVAAVLMLVAIASLLATSSWRIYAACFALAVVLVAISDELRARPARPRETRDTDAAREPGELTGIPKSQEEARRLAAKWATDLLRGTPSS